MVETVTIDGQEVEIRETDDGFEAVPVETDDFEHVVAFDSDTGFDPVYVRADAEYVIKPNGDSSTRHPWQVFFNAEDTVGGKTGNSGGGNGYDSDYNFEEMRFESADGVL